MRYTKLFVLALALGTVALTGVQAYADAPVVAITGTVVSRNGDDLLVKTEKGDLTFDIDKSTEMPTGDIPVGARITVWYDSDDKLTDKIDARKIELLPADTKITTPAPTTPPPSTPVETQTQVTTQSETREELPSTASSLPLMGVTGALALVAGAFLLRRRRI